LVVFFVYGIKTQTAHYQLKLLAPENRINII